jgi:hypothetical protein
VWLGYLGLLAHIPEYYRNRRIAGGSSCSGAAMRQRADSFPIQSRQANPFIAVNPNQPIAKQGAWRS